MHFLKMRNKSSGYGFSGRNFTLDRNQWRSWGVCRPGRTLNLPPLKIFVLYPKIFWRPFFCNLPHLPLSYNSSLKFIWTFQIFLAVPSILPPPIRVPPSPPPLATPLTGTLWRNLGKSSLEERSGLLFSEVSIVYDSHSSFKSFRYLFW